MSGIRHDGAAVLTIVVEVAHFAILVGIEVADGARGILAELSVYGVARLRSKEHIRVFVVVIGSGERVGHYATRPVLYIIPVVVLKSVPEVVFATLDEQRVGTIELSSFGFGLQTITNLVESVRFYTREISILERCGGRTGRLVEHFFKTVQRNCSCAAFETFQRISACGAIESRGSHGGKQFGVVAISTIENRLTTRFLIIYTAHHLYIIVSGRSDFAKPTISRRLGSGLHTGCCKLGREVYLFEHLIFVLRELVALLQGVVVLRCVQSGRQFRQCRNVEFVHRQVEHFVRRSAAVMNLGARGVGDGIGGCSKRCIVFRCVSSLEDGPSRDKSSGKRDGSQEIF